MITVEQFILSLARMEGILAKRFMAPYTSDDARLLAKSTAEAIQFIASDEEMVTAAVAVLNGDQ